MDKEELTRVVREYGRNVWSQSGEDGCLEYVFERIGVTNRWCFEVGASDGVFCSNTKLFRDQGWNAALVESDPDKFEKLKAACRTNEHPVRAEVGLERGRTLDDALHAAGCPQRPDLGIIDIDGQDYHVWNSLIRHRPRVMVVEYGNAGSPDFVPPPGDVSAGSAGLDAICRLGAAKGYSIVTVTPLNVIFVDPQAVPEGKSDHQQPEPVVVTENREPIRLNIGAKGINPPGKWVEVDRRSGGEAFPLKLPNTPENIELLKGRADFHRNEDGSGYWTLRDETVKEVYASHVLEHFSWHTVSAVLKEWTRVLEFGGTIRVAVPNLEWVARAYLDGKKVNVQGYLMGGQEDENDVHRCAFDNELLAELLKDLGYRDIGPWKSSLPDCASLECSLNLTGTKWYRVKPLMSMPRLSFTANWKSWVEALTPLGLLPTSYEGAFWDQCLERVMEQEMEKNDILLTLDYDTPITLDTVRHLIDLMHRHPDADAIAALQMGRGRNSPLMTVNDASGKTAKAIPREEFNKELVRAATAHFGATVIRTRGLKKMAHPWLHGQPGPDGRWNDGRVDSDISFWRKWQAAGNTLYVAPGVVVGHGEYVFTWPDENLMPIHQDTQQFFKDGPPKGVFRQGA